MAVSTGVHSRRRIDPALRRFGIGGIADWQGAILAALLFRVPPAFLDGLGVNGNFATLLFGAGLIHALMTAPNGISGQLHEAIAWLRGKMVRR